MSFELNYQGLFLINTTPETTPNYERLAKGIMTVSTSNNDNVDQTPYIDGDGYGTSTVIGKQRILSFSGHRYVGDDAQDYIATLEAELGSNVETDYKEYDADGNLKVGSCTIANIVNSGGDAQGKREFSFEIHVNGKPTATPASNAPALAIVVVGGSASGTTSFTATPGAGNSLAYRLTAAALSTPNVGSYVGEKTAYTSGSDIEATAGQYLNAYELDAYGRVVKFVADLIEAGDITA